MKIGIYDPYLDTLGGGERYVLSIADCLQSEHEVTIFWDDKDILKKIKERFLLNLDRVKIHKSVFLKNVSTLSRLKETFGLDYLFYISDGSVPLAFARNVIPIVQYPLLSVKTKNIKTRLKFVNTKLILCYSDFVKSYLQRIYPLPVQVLYPPVPQIPKTVAKERVILSVGRFTQGNNTKKQEYMIKFFNSHKLHFKGWKLILAGAVLPQDRSYLSELNKMIDKAAVEIYENVNYAQLARLYGRASIYWHAAGYGEDLVNHPERAEHFGISVVEAMSAGCVPVIYKGGGLKEIITDGKNGFFWQSEIELFNSTKVLLADRWRREEISEKAKERSKDFSVDVFCQNIKNLIGKK